MASASSVLDNWHELIKWVLATHASLWFGILIMLLLLSSMLRGRRNPSASAAWLIFMFAIPYVGIPLYLALGSRKLKSLERQKQRLFSKHTSLTPQGSAVRHLLARLGVPDPAPATDFNLHTNAEAARMRLRSIINEATQSIDIEIFILKGDATGHDLIDRLTQCALRGIHVRLLLDGVGSFLLSRKHLLPLLQAGGEVAWFIPVLHRPLRGRTNLRNHRKQVLVDQVTLWSGGRNLADEYLQDETQTHWHDLSFDFKGPVVGDFQTLFDADWAFARKRRPGFETNPLPSFNKDFPPREMQILPAGPDMKEDVLEQVLIALIREARHRIQIVTPYFVPTETLQTLLCASARSGVRIDLLLPQRSNHRIADYVRNRFLRELRGADANLYVLPDKMMHAKAWVIDGRYAVIGSANADLRSLQLNFELMTLLYAQQDVIAVQDWIDGYLSQARIWEPPRHNPLRETLEGLLMLISFQL